MARAIRTDRGWIEIPDSALTTGNVIMWGGSDFMCSTVGSAGATGPTGPTGPTGVIGASSVGSAELNSSSLITRVFDSLVIPARAFMSNVITTNLFASGSITTAIIVDANVTAAKVATNTLTESVFASGIVTTAILVASAVTGVKIDSSSILTRHIDSLQVTTPKLASGAITATTLFTVGTGVIIYGNGTIFTTLAMGANGQFLQVVGSTLVYSTDNGAGSGGASTITATLDFGTTAYQKFKLFSITDANSTTTHRVIGNILYASTDIGAKQADEYEMDSFDVKFRALSGSVECAINSLQGSFAGTVLVSYVRQ